MPVMIVQVSVAHYIATSLLPCESSILSAYWELLLIAVLRGGVGTCKDKAA